MIDKLTTCQEDVDCGYTLRMTFKVTNKIASKVTDKVLTCKTLQTPALSIKHQLQDQQLTEVVTGNLDANAVVISDKTLENECLN